MTKEGLDKKAAIELADEIGVRINAGQPVQEVMDEMIQKGAMGLKDAKEKAAFYNVLDDLVNGNDQTIKAIKKLEAKTAKQVAADKYKFGATAETQKATEDAIEDLTPLPEVDGDVLGLHTKMKIPAKEGDEALEYVISNFQEILDSPIKLQEIDLTSLKPSQAEELIQYINSFAGDLTKPAKNITEQNARRVASMIRDESNKVLEGVGGKNANIANLFRALRKTGIKGKLRGSEEAMKDQIDVIRKKIAVTGESAEIDKERLFEYLEKAGPEFAESIDEGKFLNELSKLGGMTEGVRTTNIRGLLGTAEGAVAKGANLVGRTGAPTARTTKKIANKIMDKTDDELIKASEYLLNKSGPLREMGQQLQYAMQQEGPIRNALIWSLSQQPAFRKEVDKAIESQESNYMQDLGLQQSDFTEPPSSDESVFALPPEMEEEKEDNVGRSPAANVPIVEEEDLDSMPFADAFEAHYQKVKDLPVEERPNLIWKGGEYKAVKEGEESNYNKNKPSDFSKLKKGYKVPEDYLENIPKHDKEDVEKVYRNVAEGTGLSPEEVALIGGLESFHGKLQLPLNRKTGKLISSAKGLFQFIDETRNNLTKSINSKGISLSGNPFSLEDQEKLMVELLNENKKQLKGFDPTPENQNIYELYTMHLLGPDRAKKLMTSDPETPVESILPDYVIEGNSNLLKGKNVLEAMEAIKDYLNKKGRGFEFSNQNKSVSNVFEDGGVALNEVEKNITREKKQLGSGAIAGTERSTLDDLLGSLRKLQGVSEEDMDKMEESAYSGDMNKLQELLDKLKMA